MLSDDRLNALLDDCTATNGSYPFRFARAIEAEVHKQDEALILKLVEALESADVHCSDFHHSKKHQHGPIDLCKPLGIYRGAITAGRARLEGKRDGASNT